MITKTTRMLGFREMKLKKLRDMEIFEDLGIKLCSHGLFNVGLNSNKSILHEVVSMVG
jgi:hypothetical protein